MHMVCMNVYVYCRYLHIFVHTYPVFALVWLGGTEDTWIPVKSYEEEDTYPVFALVWLGGSVTGGKQQGNAAHPCLHEFLADSQDEFLAHCLHVLILGSAHRDALHLRQILKSKVPGGLCVLWVGSWPFGRTRMRKSVHVRKSEHKFGNKSIFLTIIKCLSESIFS